MQIIDIPALTKVTPTPFSHVPKLSLSPLALQDESRMMPGIAVSVCQPHTAADVAGVLQEAISKACPVRIAGIRTGVTGGCIPENELVCDMGAMKKIGEIEIDSKTNERYVWIEAGVSIQEISNFLRKETNDAYFYPPDPTEATASLGGTIATNASGARTYRYGPTRNWIYGLQVMLPSGEILSLERGQYRIPAVKEEIRFTTQEKDISIVLPVKRYAWPSVKHTGGFYSTDGLLDPIDLFIGSEGLLGIILSAKIKLLPHVFSFWVVQFTKNENEAFDFATALDANDILRPEFIEFYDSRSLNFLRKHVSVLPVPLPPTANSAVFFNVPFSCTDRMSQEAKLETILDLSKKMKIEEDLSFVAMDVKQQTAFNELRHLLPETINRVVSERKQKLSSLHKISTDFSVPPSRFSSFWDACFHALSENNIEWVSFGHIGNAHLHINLLPMTVEEFQMAQRLYIVLAQEAIRHGGSISAEHGIGRLKRHLLPLQFSPEVILQMKAIKKAIDPHLILNPNTLW